MSEQSRIVPYCIPNPREPRTFTNDMEFAYVTLLAESRKRTSHLLPGKNENLMYLKKIGYPFILAPLNKHNVVFDGLGLSNTILEFPQFPPLELLVEEILGSVTSRSKISATLHEHKKLLKRPVKVNKTSIDGLISNRELLKDLTTGFKTETSTNETPPPLPTRYTVEEALRRADGLRTFIDSFIVHSSGLRYLAELIRVQITLIAEKTKKEVRGLTADYDQRISDLRSEVDHNIFMLERKLESETEKLKQKNWKTTEKLSGEKEKLGSQLDNLTKRLDATYERHQNAKRTKRSASKKLLRRRMEELEKETSHIRKCITKTQLEIAKIKRRSDTEERHIRREITSKIQAERTRIMKIEKEKLHTISSCEEELQSVKSLQHSILRLIVNHQNEIATQMNQIEEYALPKPVSAPPLVYLTLFCAKYRSRSQERYIVFPTCSPQKKKGLSDRIEHAIRGSKAKLESIGTPIGDGLKKFTEDLGKTLLKTDILKDEIESEKIPNILVGELRTRIHNGTNDLIREGWITGKDIDFARNLLNQI